MLSPIPGTELSNLPWRELTFDRVLQYYDGPRLLLRRTDYGQLYLAWWSDADESTERWLYLLLTQSRLRDILSGRVPSRNALNTPENGYVLVIDIASDTDTVNSVVKTNASALPQDTIPLPGAVLSISEEARSSLQASLTEAISQTPPYEYDKDTGEISIPKMEIIHLHHGMMSAATVIRDQLDALEASGVTVIVGANGPSADALNHYSQAIPIIVECGQPIRSLPDRDIGKMGVPLVQAIQLLQGLRGASQSMDKLFNELEHHQLLGQRMDLSAVHGDNWVRATEISASLDSFIRARLDVNAATEDVPARASPIDSQQLFRDSDDLTPGRFRQVAASLGQ